MASAHFQPIFNEHVWQDIISYNSLGERTPEHTQLLLDYLYHRERRHPAGAHLSVVEVLHDVPEERTKENLAKGLLALVYGVGDEELVSLSGNRDESLPTSISVTFPGRDYVGPLRQFVDPGVTTFYISYTGTNVSEET